MDHLDPRLPLVIDTRDLARRPGAMTEQKRTAPAPDDMGTEVIAVAPGEPVAISLRLEAVTEGVLVTGNAVATATGTCVRCLDPLTREVRVAFQELYAYPDRAAHHKKTQHSTDRNTAGDSDDIDMDDVEDDQHEMVGDLLDLEPVLRDALVPALPFQPVCRPDCPGLCSECGAHLADDPDHHHDDLDPRWAALHRLTSQN